MNRRTVVDQVQYERRRAIRALLMRPLLVAGGQHQQEFALVRRHADHLRGWFQRQVGWTLTVDAEVARLRKTPGSTDDPFRGAVDETSGLPFTRRRYVLFCLALATLERSERQTTLGKLKDGIDLLLRTDPAFAEAGIELDLAGQDCRRDLVHAARKLLELEILVRVHGDEQQFLTNTGDVLYSVRRAALALCLVARRPPSTIGEEGFEERLSELLDENSPESDEARNRQHALTLGRRLLDDPVLYFDALTAEQQAYLVSQRVHLARRIEEATGLVAESRREGLAMVDEGGALTDLAVPDEGTEGHLALLLAEFLASHARQSSTPFVATTELRGKVAELIELHGRHWRKEAREPGAAPRLCEETLDRLAAVGLLRRAPEGVIPLAAIGRYALEAPQLQDEPPATDLFGAPTGPARTRSPRRRR